MDSNVYNSRNTMKPLFSYRNFMAALTGVLLLGNTATAQQIITTYAGNGAIGYSGDGGAATAASMQLPQSVAVDASGNLYIADQTNHVIRKVSSLGIMSTLAGTGTSGYTGNGGPATAAQISDATGIAADAAGNVYFSDYNNQVVRKVDAAGIITLFAGNHTAGYSGNGGPATAAQLSNPTGVAVDAAGNVYIAEASNNVVRVVNTSGVISVYAGNATGGYSGDGGPATAAQLSDIESIAIDAAGNLYLAQYPDMVVRKVAAGTGIITTFAGNGTNGYSGDGSAATAAQISSPYSVATDRSGNVYIADANNAVVRKVTPTGIISTFAGSHALGSGFAGDGGPATAAQISTVGLATDNNGNLYLGDFSNHRVRRVANSAPVFTGGSTQSLTVCQNAAATSINILLSASDANVGQTLNWTVSSAAAHGSLAATFSASSTGGTLVPTGLTYTPTSGYAGTDAFTIKIDDGAGGVATTTINVTVNALPAAITGLSQVCAGSTITLSSGPSGGSWSSSSITTATVGTSGIVSGLAAGTTIITYTLPTTCNRTYDVTVNALPIVHNVTGGGPYCTGGLGVHIGMDNSESGNTYQLYMGGTLMGIRPGTGGTVDFGSLLSAGTYTVLATSPASCDNNMAGSATISILPLVTPSVSVATTPGDTVCAGTSTTFTATPVNGGTTPAYEWKVNGTTVATTTAAHVYAPADGDVVTVIMTSSEACPSPATASASQTMVVVSNETPVVSIAVGPNDTLCQGSYAAFTAGAAFGGTAPVFTWYKNGVSTTITGGTYTYIPVNGDIISAKLNSNYRCPIVNNVASNNIPMHIDSVYIPIIVINTNTGLTVKTGTSVTFTATILKGDPTSQYQWYRNTSMLVGATNATYTSSSLVNGDSISCWVQGLKDCSYYSYNSVKMKIHNEVATVGTEADIKLVPNPNNGEFTLSGSMPSAGNSEVALEVVNMVGQVVYKGTTTPSGGNIDAHIRLGNSLSNGMYILTVHSGTDSKTFRFVVRQ